MIYFAYCFGFGKRCDFVFQSEHGQQEVLRIMSDVAAILTKDSPISGVYTVCDFFVRDDFWEMLKKHGINRINDDDQCEMFVGDWSLANRPPSSADDLGAVLYRAINWENKAQYKARQKAEAKERQEYHKKMVKEHNEKMKEKRRVWRETADRLSGRMLK